MMRVDKEYNNKSVIEDTSVNRKNIMKIQDALKDLEFKEEDEIMMQNKLINQNKIEAYDDIENKCHDLDGWDDDIPLAKQNIYTEAIYNFMGI